VSRTCHIDSAKLFPITSSAQSTDVSRNVKHVCDLPHCGLYRVSVGNISNRMLDQSADLAQEIQPRPGSSQYTHVNSFIDEPPGEGCAEEPRGAGDERLP